MSGSTQPPTLVCLIGPPAVGKMTVGQELARLTGFHLLHHHQLLDLIATYFAFGAPAFDRLVQSWRLQFHEEAARGGLNLITTSAWAFDEPENTAFIGRIVQPYHERGGRVCFVELTAPLPVLLARNRTENRRRHKQTAWATDDYMRAFITAHRWESGEAFPFTFPVLRVQTDHLSAAETAQRICAYFALPRIR
jgi:hypothetical protein